MLGKMKEGIKMINTFIKKEDLTELTGLIRIFGISIGKFNVV